MFSLKSFVKIVAFSLSFILASCGKGEYDKEKLFEFKESNPEFQYYQDAFAKELFARSGRVVLKEVRINLVEKLELGRIGICKDWGSVGEILIRRDWWESERISDDTREKLIFHELGHCLLSRGHYDEKVGNRPVSIMNTYVTNDSIYRALREDYLDELFLNQRSSIKDSLSVHAGTER